MDFSRGSHPTLELKLHNSSPCEKVLPKVPVQLSFIVILSSYLNSHVAVLGTAKPSQDWTLDWPFGWTLAWTLDWVLESVLVSLRDNSNNTDRNLWRNMVHVG